MIKITDVEDLEANIEMFKSRLASLEEDTFVQDLATEDKGE